MVQDVLDRLGVENAWQGPVGPVGLAMVSIERLAERPDAHLVYVDAVVPKPGESWSATHASATSTRISLLPNQSRVSPRSRNSCSAPMPICWPAATAATPM